MINSRRHPSKLRVCNRLDNCFQSSRSPFLDQLFVENRGKWRKMVARFWFHERAGFASPFFFFLFFVPFGERSERSSVDPADRQRFRERAWHKCPSVARKLCTGKESGEGPVVVFAATASRKPSCEIQKSYFIEDAYLVSSV